MEAALPDEIVGLIVVLLDVRTVVAFSQTCRRFRMLVLEHHERLLKQLPVIKNSYILQSPFVRFCLERDYAIARRITDKKYGAGEYPASFTSPSRVMNLDMFMRFLCVLDYRSKTFLRQVSALHPNLSPALANLLRSLLRYITVHYFAMPRPYFHEDTYRPPNWSRRPIEDLVREQVNEYIFVNSVLPEPELFEGDNNYYLRTEGGFLLCLSHQAVWIATQWSQDWVCVPLLASESEIASFVLPDDNTLLLGDYQFPIWLGNLINTMNAMWQHVYDDWVKRYLVESNSPNWSSWQNDMYYMAANMNIYQSMRFDLNDIFLEELERARMLALFHDRIKRASSALLRKAASTASTRNSLLVYFLDNLKLTEDQDQNKPSKANAPAAERCIRRLITFLFLPILQKFVFGNRMIMLALHDRMHPNLLRFQMKDFDRYWNDSQEIWCIKNQFPSAQFSRGISQMRARFDFFAKQPNLLLHNSYVHLWPLFLLDRACAMIFPAASLLSTICPGTSAKLDSQQRNACIEIIVQLTERNASEVDSLFQVIK